MQNDEFLLKHIKKLNENTKLRKKKFLFVRIRGPFGLNQKNLKNDLHLLGIRKCDIGFGGFCHANDLVHFSIESDAIEFLKGRIKNVDLEWKILDDKPSKKSIAFCEWSSKLYHKKKYYKPHLKGLAVKYLSSTEKGDYNKIYEYFYWKNGETTPTYYDPGYEKTDYYSQLQKE